MYIIILFLPLTLGEVFIPSSSSSFYNELNGEVVSNRPIVQPGYQLNYNPNNNEIRSSSINVPSEATSVHSRYSPFLPSTTSNFQSINYPQLTQTPPPPLYPGLQPYYNPLTPPASTDLQSIYGQLGANVNSQANLNPISSSFKPYNPQQPSGYQNIEGSNSLKDSYDSYMNSRSEFEQLLKSIWKNNPQFFQQPSPSINSWNYQPQILPPQQNVANQMYPSLRFSNPPVSPLDVQNYYPMPNVRMYRSAPELFHLSETEKNKPFSSDERPNLFRGRGSDLRNIFKQNNEDSLPSHAMAKNPALNRFQKRKTFFSSFKRSSDEKTNEDVHSPKLNTTSVNQIDSKSNSHNISWPFHNSKPNDQSTNTNEDVLKSTTNSDGFHQSFNQNNSTMDPPMENFNRFPSSYYRRGDQIVNDFGEISGEMVTNNNTMGNVDGVPPPNLPLDQSNNNFKGVVTNNSSRPCNCAPCIIPGTLGYQSNSWMTTDSNSLNMNGRVNANQPVVMHYMQPGNIQRTAAVADYTYFQPAIHQNPSNIFYFTNFSKNFTPKIPNQMNPYPNYHTIYFVRPVQANPNWSRFNYNLSPNYPPVRQRKYVNYNPNYFPRS